MNNDFPRILSLLRKEKGISQKQAAADLGVAQALLSHYEKGKRECGLDFLVKAADYYDVTADYLLGRSPIANGKTLTSDELPDASLSEKARNMSSGEVSAAFAKKLTENGIQIIYALLGKTDDTQLTEQVHNIFSYNIYRAFRYIFRANRKNDLNFFKIADEASDQLTSAGEAICYANAQAAVSNCENAPLITRKSLEEDYGKSASVLFTTVMQCETKLSKLN